MFLTFVAGDARWSLRVLRVFAPTAPLCDHSDHMSTSFPLKNGLWFFFFFFSYLNVVAVLCTFDPFLCSSARMNLLFEISHFVSFLFRFVDNFDLVLPHRHLEEEEKNTRTNWTWPNWDSDWKLVVVVIIIVTTVIIRIRSSRRRRSRSRWWKWRWPLLSWPNSR